MIVVAGCSKKNPVVTATTGIISGVVTDSVNGIAIAGAGITTNPATSSVTADTAGKFTITGVNVGTYTVTAVKIGYLNKSVSVTVTQGTTATANITLVVGLGSIAWVNIPAGNFTMGSTAADTVTWHNTSDEYPQHTVYLNAFQISKYEITNSQYKVFMDAGGYNNSTYWSIDGWSWVCGYNITEPYFWRSGSYNSGTAFPNHPIVGISWYEADAFCKWAGARLPTEAEWEKAARGTDARYWPWGDAWDASKCNSHFNTTPDTFTYSSPVGYFNAGIGPYGVYDMAGNVWEWVNDKYQSNYYSISPDSNPTGPTNGIGRVARGGWCVSDYRSADRTGAGPDNRGAYLLGFRPAK